MVEGLPFGCELLPIHGRSVQRYSASGHARFDDNGRLPMRLFRHLRPRVDRIRVLVPGGTCEPRLGQAIAQETPTNVQIVAQSMGGCGREHSSFAFAGCDVPEWLRYQRLVSTIEHQPRRGPLDDPMLEALITAEPEFVAATQSETERERRARLRRRSRRSVIRTEREELLIVELHRFLEGSHPCESDEDVAHSIQVRSVHEDTPGPWRTLHTRGRVVGAYLDDYGFIVAFDTRPPRGSGYDCAHEGWDCNIMAIEGRSSVEPAAPLATRDFLFGGNWLSHESDSPMLNHLECRQSGY